MTMDNANWQFGAQPPMEPIIEEDDYMSPSCSYALLATTGGDSVQATPSRRKNLELVSQNLPQSNFSECRIIESKQRVREIHTTEEVDTLISTLPKEAIPEQWKHIPSEEVVVDSSMAHTYLTELAGGIPSARSSKYTYTYETHVDEPETKGYATLNNFHSQSDIMSSPASTAAMYANTSNVQSHDKRNGDVSAKCFDYKNENGVELYNSPATDLERHSTSTQKVTRVTKITTTRSVRQIPVNPDNIVFDADGNPLLNSFDNVTTSSPQYDGDDYAVDKSLDENYANGSALGIDLSRTFISEHEEYSTSPTCSTSFPATLQPPSSISYDGYMNGVAPRDYALQNGEISLVPVAPGIPEITEIHDGTISLRWHVPSRDGTAGPILGYRVEFRRAETDIWEPAHDDLLTDNECKITNLESEDTYFFRTSAANCAGFGTASGSTPPIYINPDGSAQIANPSRPSRPIIVDVGNDCATIEWHTNLYDSTSIIGYMVEYRPQGATSWTSSNDYPVPGPRHVVENLRPNGIYEFQILAKDCDGKISAPSVSSGPVQIRPAVPIRTTHSQVTEAIAPPGQPQAVEIGSESVRIKWTPSSSTIKSPVTRFDAITDTTRDDNIPTISYLLEGREIDESFWTMLSPPMLVDSHFTVQGLKPNSIYEFRVSALSLKDNLQSSPSSISSLIRTLPKEECAFETEYDTQHTGLPKRPSPPQLCDFGSSSNSVTICWEPAQSRLPILGYEVEFRDLMEGDNWQKFSVAPHIVQRCKTTIGNLFRGHQYQFRIFAHNANGRSPPSDSSMIISIGTSLKDAKYVEAERHATVALLQDEMIRESPPIPDRDDSPPPIYRQPPGDNLQYRDPTLKEVIDYLKKNDQNILRDASSYLQRLTFNNDSVKEDTRNYGGIVILIELLKKENQDLEILRNVCGCLKNLAFGKSAMENKKQIVDCGGIPALANVIQHTKNLHVIEEATNALYNISFLFNKAKLIILEKATIIVTNFVVIPFSGFVTLPALERQEIDPHQCINNFRSGVGILRNISCVNDSARKILRSQPNLIDAILHFFANAVYNNQIKSRAVENCVCLLRNLSYRVQEVVDPKFDPSSKNNRNSITRTNNGTGSARERSKSAPSFSPKGKLKTSKKNEIAKNMTYGNRVTNKKSGLFPEGKSMGPSRLWHFETVKLYLHILQECTNPIVLEASAAAIQNLAACSFYGSAEVRTAVRVHNGLPILCELLQLRDDLVVKSIVCALRNLAFDPINLQEISKYALCELIEKLPRTGQITRNENISGETMYAILCILHDMIAFSSELALSIHNAGGTERLIALERLYPAYDVNVCRNAVKVLYNMWKYKELHETFQRSGFNERDFHATTLSRARRPIAHGTSTPTPSGQFDGTETLTRAFSSQGGERHNYYNTDANISTPNSASNGITGNSFDNDPLSGTSRSAPIEHTNNGGKRYEREISVSQPYR